MSKLNALVLDTSIANDDGADDDWPSAAQAKVAMSLSSPCVDQALSPAVESAVMMTPSWSRTSTGGVDGCVAISVSVLLQLPLDQLCLSLYCLFQLVDLPSLTRRPSSSHFESLEEYSNDLFKVPVSRRPGIRRARGRTNRS